LDVRPCHAQTKILPLLRAWAQACMHACAGFRPPTELENDYDNPPFTQRRFSSSLTEWVGEWTLSVVVLVRIGMAGNEDILRAPSPDPYTGFMTERAIGIV